MSLLHPKYPVAGVDISFYQYPIKFDVLIPKIDYAIIKAGGGLLNNGGIKEDYRFKEFYRAFDNRVPLGVYWYWHPGYSGKEQGEAFLEITNSISARPELGYYIDLEEKNYTSYSYKVKQQFTQNILEFLSVVDNKVPTLYNKYVNIYTGGPYWNNYVDHSKIPNLINRVAWVAQYFNSYPMDKPTVTLSGINKIKMWQYSRKGGVPDTQTGIGKTMGVYSFGLDVNAWLLKRSEFETYFHYTLPKEDLTKNLPYAIKPFKLGTYIRSGPSELTYKAVASSYTEPLEVILAVRDNLDRLWYQVGKNMYVAAWLGEPIYK